MTNFVSLTLSGAVSGAIYALLAIGLVHSYSTSWVFNFGQAAIAFSCAYLGTTNSTRVSGGQYL